MDVASDLRRKRRLYHLIISQLLMDGHNKPAETLKQALNIDRKMAPSSELMDTFKELSSALNDDPSLASSLTHTDDGLQFQREVDPSMVNAGYVETITAPLTGNPECITFSEDGQLAIVGCQDGSIRIFDVPASLSMTNETTTSTVLCKMMDLRTSITAIAMHPSAKLIVAGSILGLYLYDIATYREPKTHFRFIEDHFPTTSLAFHPSGTYLAVGTAHPEIRLYETKGWECYTLPENSQHSAPITAVQYNHAGDRLASCCKAGVFKIWDVVSSACLISLEDVFDGAAAHSIWFSASDEHVLIGGQDTNAVILDANNGKRVATYEVPYPPVGASHGAFFGATEMTVMSMTAISGQLQIWNAQSGATLTHMSCFKAMKLTCAATHQGQAVLVAGCDDKIIRFWKLDKPKDREVKKEEGEVKKEEGEVKKEEGEVKKEEGEVKKEGEVKTKSEPPKAEEEEPSEGAVAGAAQGQTKQTEPPASGVKGSEGKTMDTQQDSAPQ